jgi:hypothetical protein
MKKMYELKAEEGKETKNPVLTASKLEEKKKGLTHNEQSHMGRSKVVVSLFQEFHSQAYEYGGLKFIIDFLIKISSERTLGYQAFLVYECKTNENRFFFAEVLLELISDYKDYQNADNLCKVIELLIFEAPNIFKPTHLEIIKRKLVDLLLNGRGDSQLAIILKTIYILHRLKNYDKNQEVKALLKNLL